MDDKPSDLLDKPLNRKHVSKRNKSGISLSYIEGHHVIREANRIFGYEGWSMSVESLTLTDCGKNSNGNCVISAQALVIVEALNCSRHDVGYGTGIGKSIADANEGAGKEAITDAMKRAFRTFGDQFGNALYDKSQKHVVDEEPMNEHTLKIITNRIDGCKSYAELCRLWATLAQDIKDQVKEDFIAKAEVFPEYEKKD